ncbi:HEAT repeat domain-containing protein [Polyangium jinanense]|uniref:HEAT repeat domain-containing protein n=1 Tax=Polyangium jinanense TaxID=2829994 RepID=A0A9X3X9S3_9BACT|nr:hypothetical protein [Polyangium jinanense]MDC3959876.1 hypothetical protein [Polyangium jinanense]MDC3986327.1 hypothetical protein [Polyangium jinanense]
MSMVDPLTDELEACAEALRTDPFLKERGWEAKKFCHKLLSRGDPGLAVVRGVVRGSSYEPLVRASTARALSPDLDPVDVEHTCSLLLSGKALTRYMAAVALCRTASPASVDALVEALDDDELIEDMWWVLYVSDVVALALTRIGDIRAPALAAWYERRRRQLHDPSYRGIAVCALARVGDAQGRAILEELAATGHDMAEDVLDCLRNGDETYL